MDYSTLPERFSTHLAALRESGEFQPQWELLRGRTSDLPHRTAKERTLAAELMTIAMNPTFRQQLERKMDKDWDGDRIRNMGMGSRPHVEVVIGAGYHAAIYCAVRKAMGKPPPLVIEQSERVGGTFACSQGPSFWSNSRNRPGPANAPGLGDGLNTIPGAAIQPSMISSEEYQSNADLAFVIRLTLAMTAKVATCKQLVAIEAGTSRARWSLVIQATDDRNGEEFRIRSDRVVDARGLGPEKRTLASSLPNNPYVLTFKEFMARMDKPFPLQGLRRVAVIGGGDSGKCAVEALFGMSPTRHMSVPDLDRIERCDWYARVPAGCEEFRNQVRSRYKGISTLLLAERSPARLKVIRSTGVGVRGDYDGVIVGERRYDLAIYCGGFGNHPALGGGYLADPAIKNIDGTAVGFQYGPGLYAVGPVANLGYSEIEANQPWSALEENRVAMWRLGPRTALLASRL